MRQQKRNGSGKTIDRSQVHGVKFNSITEFNKYLENGTIKHEFVKKYGVPSSVTGSADWTGTDSYEQATDLLLNGDPSATKYIDDHGYKATVRNITRTEKQRATVLAPCGFLPHVPNFLAGRPNNMMAERVTLKRKKVITVAYNVAALGSAEVTEMLNTAINVLSAIMRCEAGGVRINLWAVSISGSYSCGVKHYATTAVRIKDSDQHIDVRKMAYPMTNPSMHRRHVFRFREVLPGLPKSFADGYGHTETDVDTMDACLKNLGINADCVLGFYGCKNMGQEQIMNEITQVNK